MLGLTIPCWSKSGHAKSGMLWPAFISPLSRSSLWIFFSSSFYLLSSCNSSFASVSAPMPSWDEQINNLSMPWIWYVILASRRRLYTNLIPKNWRISFNGRNQHLWSMDTGTAYWYVEAKKPRKIGTDTDMPNIRSWKNVS